MFNFQHLKVHVIHWTGLERDALHIYVGIGVFLITLLVTRLKVKRHITRLNIALVMATLFALGGEYLDLSYNYPHLTWDMLAGSIHDIINTCFWPYVLYATNRWTPMFDRR